MGNIQGVHNHALNCACKNCKIIRLAKERRASKPPRPVKKLVDQPPKQSQTAQPGELKVERIAEARPAPVQPGQAAPPAPQAGQSQPARQLSPEAQATLNKIKAGQAGQPGGQAGAAGSSAPTPSPAASSARPMPLPDGYVAPPAHGSAQATPGVKVDITEDEIFCGIKGMIFGYHELANLILSTSKFEVSEKAADNCAKLWYRTIQAWGWTVNNKIMLLIMSIGATVAMDAPLFREYMEERAEKKERAAKAKEKKDTSTPAPVPLASEKPENDKAPKPEPAILPGNPADLPVPPPKEKK